MKAIGKAFCWVAVFGVTVSAACLSFGGIFALPVVSVLFLISRREAAAKLSSFFAMAIEGTIYKQNTDAAINFSLEHSIIKRLLKKKKLAKALANSGFTNEFLQDYKNQTTYLHELEEGLDYFRFHFRNQNHDREIAEREILAVKKRLEMMETLFLTRLRDRTLPQTDSIEKSIDALLNQKIYVINKEDIQNEIKRKGWQLFFSKIASLGAGVCCCFVTLGSFHTNLITMGYQFASILLMGGSIISGLAGVGYLLLMYRTLSSLIESEMVKEWCKKVKNFYNKENKDCWDYAKAFALSLFVITAVVGTVATAGTWFSLGTFGAAFLPPVLATVMSSSTWACMLVPTLLYNVLNTVKSLYKFPEMFRNFRRKTANDFKEACKSENLAQLINPFRLLMKISKVVIFIGHVLSTGAASASDKNPFIASTELAVMANAITEGTTDLHQIIDSGDHAEEEEDDHHHGCNSSHHSHDHGSNTAQNEEKEEKDNHPGYSSNNHNHNPGNNTTQNEEDEEDEDDHHHHGGIILDQIEWVLKGLAIAWDFAAGNYFGLKNLYNCCIGQSDRYIIENAINKFYPTKKLPVVPRLSEAWAKHEVDTKFEKEKAYYHNKGIQDKECLFSTLKKDLIPETKASAADSNKELPEEIPPSFFDTLNAKLPAIPAKSEKANKNKQEQKNVSSPAENKNTSLVTNNAMSGNLSALFTHRNPLKKRFSSSLPRSGEFIQDLILDRSFNLRGG